MSNDHCRPTAETVRCIYDALLAEQEHRPARELDQRVAAERTAVLLKTNEVARVLGLMLVTHEDVKRAEAYASGSTDYSAKFAYRSVQTLREKQETR